MVSYYNEIDPYAAQWLRNLIANKLIADGDVDERSIRDVAAADLHGYTQCHFFAGIGVWSHALRLAGWPDDRPVWTGSCPCQPFSAAGKGKGFEDERHLWPAFHMLINERQPPVVFGEQVASKDGLAWLDTVHADLQASGYACGAVDWCAAGVGAPHIRQRLWFVGERLDYTPGARHLRALAGAEGEARDEARLRLPGEGRGPSGLGDADSTRHEGHGLQPIHGSGEGRGPLGRAAGSSAAGGLGHDDDARLERQRRGHQAEGGWDGAAGSVAEAGEPRGLADADQGERRRFADGEGRQPDWSQAGWQQGDGEPQSSGSTSRPSPTNGHWGDADWLHCRDGRWRPVEPGTFPLAHGAPARVGRLRAYGNAIVPQAAAEVIGAYLDARP